MALFSHSSSSFRLLSSPSSSCSSSSSSPPIPINASLPTFLLSPSFFPLSSSSSPPNLKITRRTTLLATTASILLRSPPARSEEEDGEEERSVRVFQEATASVVCIKNMQLAQRPSEKSGDRGEEDVDRDLKVDGEGSGFVWDDKGHIVTNYHVIAKLATDNTGLQLCKVYYEDSTGTKMAKIGKLIGFDPTFDLAVLKIEIGDSVLKPAMLGTSSDLRVGQSCFAIGNPYGYEHTLTTGVISGLKREIPSPNGQAIRGVIQTDAAINSGNSGGPLIDSYGHVIGVNTATFTRKGSGLSSGVNFAIPIDTVVLTIPYLIIYGTSTTNRF